MQFLNPRYENEELTFDDVFLLQWYFDGTSRMKDLDLTPWCLNLKIPIISANMNSVTGKRFSETIARYGGLGILPQDMSNETMIRIIQHIKTASVEYDTALTVTVQDFVRDCLDIIYKRDHGCVVVLDGQQKPISLLTVKDLQGLDPFTPVAHIIKNKLPIVVGKIGISSRDAFNLMHEERINALPIVSNEWALIWILTKKWCVRKDIYTPTLDAHGRLDVGVAVGINSYQDRLDPMIELGVTTIVLDTAHGYQKNMIEAIKNVKARYGKQITLVAGNIISEKGVEDLLDAWADGIKVGVGPGAMCTTRMKTAVGRPQITAVYKCSLAAKKKWGFVWADGGIRTPRDVCLVLAAGASHAFFGSIFAGTYESTWTVKIDMDGQMYKENFGMASGRAVTGRNEWLDEFDLVKKSLFQEGISHGKAYLQKGREGLGDIMDDLIFGLRSSMTYVGGKTIQEYQDKAVMGVQTSSWYREGAAIDKMRYSL